MVWLSLKWLIGAVIVVSTIVLILGLTSSWLALLCVLASSLAAGFVIDHWSGVLLAPVFTWLGFTPIAWQERVSDTFWRERLTLRALDNTEGGQMFVFLALVPIPAAAALGIYFRRALRRRRART